MRRTERLATRTETSDEAFAVAPNGAAARVLDAIRAMPRSTDELMADLGMPHTTCSARVNQLMRSGHIEDRGVRTMTRANRKAIVWFATDNPAPITPERPTRAQLEDRIVRAIAAIAHRESDAVVVRILGGEA